MHPNQFFNHVTMLNESFIPGGAFGVSPSKELPAGPGAASSIPNQSPVPNRKRGLQDSGKIRSIAARLR